MPNALICVMDDLAAIKPIKDTTFALMLEAQRRGLPVWYANEADLVLSGSLCRARLRRVSLTDCEKDYFSIEETTHRALGAGDLVMMRCDPPVDDNYLYATMLLDRAQANGARVVNNPRARWSAARRLRCANSSPGTSARYSSRWTGWADAASFSVPRRIRISTSSSRR